MLQHHLKIIFRRLRQQWLFSGIHLVGLTLGISSCLLIYLFICHETSFDTHHSNAQNIYRVNTYAIESGQPHHSMNAPYPMGEVLRADFPDWEKTGSMHWQSSHTLRLPDNTLVQLEEGMYAEPQIWEMFSFEALKGKGKEALETPGNILLSESTAARLFGQQTPIGQQLRLNDTVAFEVAGVYADLPATTHLPANFLVSYASLSSDIVGFDIESWGVTIAGSIYTLLPEGDAPSVYESRLATFADKYLSDDEGGSSSNTIVLQPLQDIHFNTAYDSISGVNPINPAYLWIFGSIGLLTLAMACFNFLNLSLAQSARKTAETGMRKILGAGPAQLWSQFFGEAIVLSLAAFGISLMLVSFLLPRLGEMLNKELQWADSSTAGLAIFSVLLVLVMSLLAGAYPAWVQARHRPLEVIQSSKVVGSRPGNRLRQFTVLSQFVITLTILSCAFTVARQLHHIRNKDLGFKKEAILQVQLNQPGNQPALRQEWLKLPEVKEVSFAIGAPTSNGNLHTSFHPLGSNPKENTYRIAFKAVDPHYEKLYGLQLLAGKFISEQDARLIGDGFPAAEQACNIVVNHALIKELGYTTAEEALGKRLVLGINNIQAAIVGIVADFHTTTLHEAVEPTVLMPLPILYYNIGIKLSEDAGQAALKQLEATFHQFFPNQIFEHEFLDESIASAYRSEQRLFSLLQIFGGLTIFIACLGLFGLASLAVVHRRKEISLRKILGASVTSILRLLSKDTLRLVTLALLIATPLSWWAMNDWLANFAYRIQLSPLTTLLAGVDLLVLALLTTSGQVIKAALSNPADSLKQE
jgi:ABC-type antimicrobial peptide transport system permease subunit